MRMNVLDPLGPFLAEPFGDIFLFLIICIYLRSGCTHYNKVNLIGHNVSM